MATQQMDAETRFCSVFGHSRVPLLRVTHEQQGPDDMLARQQPTKQP